MTSRESVSGIVFSGEICPDRIHRMNRKSKNQIESHLKIIEILGDRVNGLRDGDCPVIEDRWLQRFIAAVRGNPYEDARVMDASSMSEFIGKLNEVSNGEKQGDRKD